jgi:hypothetical protein
MAGEERKLVALTKQQADYLFMLVSIHQDDPDADGIRQILDVPRAEWDFEAEQEA